MCDAAYKRMYVRCCFYWIIFRMNGVCSTKLCMPSGNLSRIFIYWAKMILLFFLLPFGARLLWQRVFFITRSYSLRSLCCFFVSLVLEWTLFSLCLSSTRACYKILSLLINFIFFWLWTLRIVYILRILFSYEYTYFQQAHGFVRIRYSRYICHVYCVCY